MPLELKIIMQDNGAVGMSGPMENMVLCLGLLEVGKVVLMKHHENKDNRIVPAEGPIPPFISN